MKNKWQIPDGSAMPEPPSGLTDFITHFSRGMLLKQHQYLELLAGAFAKVCGDVDPRRITLVRRDNFMGRVEFWYELRPEETEEDKQ